MKNSFFILILCFFAGAAFATPLNIAYDKSEIGFAGEHAGKAFRGIFGQWQAEIDLEAGRIAATFDLSQAKTNNRTYDSNLLKKDWFWVKRYPEAKFVSENVRPVKAGTYQVEGLLTIRDITLPITFTLLLENQSLSSSFVLDRLAYDIGKSADLKAEWVSRNITVTLAISLTP
jgi:polyisoprenoid-binding protein YceI